MAPPRDMTLKDLKQAEYEGNRSVAMLRDLLRMKNPPNSLVDKCRAAMDAGKQASAELDRQGIPKDERYC